MESAPITARFPLSFANFLFLSRFEMCQSFLSMRRGNVRMTLLAGLDGRLEVSDALLGMRVVLCRLCRLGMLERGFGMRYEHIRMALLAVIDGLLSMADGFGQMIFGQSATRHEQGSSAKYESESENPAVHDCVLLVLIPQDDWRLGPRNWAHFVFGKGRRPCRER